VCSCAYIENGDQLLLVLRKSPPYAKSWVGPGGRPKKGETYPETVIREVKEEIGFDVQVRKYLGNVSFPSDHDSSKRCRVEVYNCKVIGGEMKISENEIADARWVSKDEILSLGLAKPVEVFYKELLNSEQFPISVLL